MSDDVHEVYATGTAITRKASANYIDGDPHDVLQSLDFFVWAIVGPSGTIVLDTGFDEAVGKKRQREMIKPLREGLAALGIAPESVKDVIISHLHCDHCGNYDLFPQARYHLQDREMAYASAACATARCGCRSRSRMWSPWCASCSPAAAHSTTARIKSCRASPCIISQPQHTLINRAFLRCTAN